jgi:purine-binding chemotaxis protein CheW
MYQTALTQPAEGATKLAGKYLTFALGQEFYGIAVLHVREIIRHTAITPVPNTQSFVRGVLNLRGKVIPVIDLRLKFQLAKAEIAERTCIVVVQVTTAAGSRSLMGFIVDGVEAVVDISSNEIEATPDFGLSLDTGYILAMAKLDGKVVALLDTDKVASCESNELPGATSFMAAPKSGHPR